MKKKHAFILLLVLTFVLQACAPEQAVSAQRNLVLTVDRLQSNIGNAVVAIETLYDNKLISQSGATKAALTVQGINAASGHFIDGLNQYIETDANGNKVLKITDQGVVDVQKLADETAAALVAALDDPVLYTNSNNTDIAALVSSVRNTLKAVLQVKNAIRKPMAVALGGKK